MGQPGGSLFEMNYWPADVACPGRPAEKNDMTGFRLLV
jgi:hypothetical protein